MVAEPTCGQLLLKFRKQAAVNLPPHVACLIPQNKQSFRLYWAFAIIQEMQEQLLKRGAATEAHAKALAAHLSSKDIEIALLAEKQVQQQRLHQNELAEMNKKQNILQSEFAEMLKDTVQHLHAQRKAAYAKVAHV